MRRCLQSETGSAGLDIITDGEMRRVCDGIGWHRYRQSRHRAGSQWTPESRAARCRQDPEAHPVQVRDVKFLRANTDRMIKMTVPGAFTMAQQAQNDFWHVHPPSMFGSIEELCTSDVRSIRRVPLVTR